MCSKIYSDPWRCEIDYRMASRLTDHAKYALESVNRQATYGTECT
jgi:hypothetical protein